MARMRRAHDPRHWMDSRRACARRRRRRGQGASCHEARGSLHRRHRRCVQAPRARWLRRRARRQRAGTADHRCGSRTSATPLTADDEITHALRTKFVALVGDGGPGFAFARHRPTRTASTRADRRGHRRVARPRGLAGRAARSPARARREHGDRRWRVDPGSSPWPRHADRHPLPRAARGGSFAVLGRPASRSPRSRRRRSASRRRSRSLRGARRCDQSSSSPPVAASACSVRPSRRRRGAVVDNLGVVNATAKQLTTHNLAAHWKNAARASWRGSRDRDAAAPNEAEWARGEQHGDEGARAAVRASSWRPSVPRARRARALVVSPLDSARAAHRGDAAARVDRRDGRGPAPARRRRRVARFWDTYAWMGGKARRGPGTSAAS